MLQCLFKFCIAIWIYFEKRIGQSNKSRSNIFTGHQPQDLESSHKTFDQPEVDRQHVEAANAGAIGQNVRDNAQVRAKNAQFGKTRWNDSK